MRRRIHFISGLPRSGSTLLAALLRQNPRFHARMTSPLGHIYLTMQTAVSRKSEGSGFLTVEQKRDLLRGVFENYYAGVGADRVVFDTNRVWCSKMPQIADHFPDAKVICCVRHVPWVIDSIERLIRRNVTDLSGIFGYDPGGTVYTRANRLAASDGLVGYALDALREAFFGEHADRLMLVTYEALTRDPAATLAAIYDFVGEAPFAHDFENVEYAEDEFDGQLGTPGLHTVRRRVEFAVRQTVLPPELFNRFVNDAFWMDQSLNRAARIVRYVG
jgi:sulfotransferase